jgi:hypothetical protein
MPSRRTVAALVPVAGLCAAAALADPAYAQSCGGCAGPAVPGGGAQRTWLEEGAFSARLSAGYEVKDETFKGHGKVPNDFDETLRIRRLDLALRYGLSDAWTAGIDLSDPEYHYRLKPPGGERQDIVVRGPGDTVLRVARRFDLEEEEPEAAAPANPLLYIDPREERIGSLLGVRPIDVPTVTVIAGLSLPTGDVKKPNPAIVNQDFSVSNLQTGTGTFDPLLEVRFDLPKDEWRFFAQAAALVPLAENRHDYKTAATLAFTVGAERDLGGAWRAGLAATFQRVGTDEFEGDDVGVGGGKWVYVTPSLAWDVSERATLDAGVRIVAFRDADTKLVDSDASFQVGLTIRF